MYSRRSPYFGGEELVVDSVAGVFLFFNGDVCIGSSPEDKSQDKQNSKLLQHQQPEKEVNMASKPAGDTDFSAIASISEQEETSTSTCHAFHNPNCNTRNHRKWLYRASKIAVATVRPQQHNNRPAAMESEDLQHQHIVCDIVVDKPGGRCSTTSVNNQQRSPTEEPPPKRQSEYAQLSELVQYFEDSSCSDPFKMKSSTLEVPCNIDEDAVSIAGTDFNEPWDSNAWDNLLDLARFGDEKPSTANAIRTLHSTDTIVEEDDLNTSAISADEEIQEGDHHHNPHHQHQTDVVVLRPRNGSSTCSMDKSNNNDGNNVEAGGRKFKLLALNNYGYESESLADEEEEEQDEFEAFTNDIEASTSGSYDKDTAAKSDRLLSSKEAAAMAAVLASSGSCSGDGNVNWPFKAPTFGIAAWMKPREDGNSMKVPLVEQEDFKNGVVRSRHRGGSQQHRNRMASQQNNNNNQPGQFNPLHGSLTDLRVPSLSHNTSDPSCILQKYVEYLAADESTMFGSTLHRFIECTIESEETDPSVVIRRVRQFLNGMKNYLVKNGELDLHGIIERESENGAKQDIASAHQSPSIPSDGQENTRNGELQRLSENLSFIRAMEPQELGFSPHTAMPDQITMEHIRALLRKMQHHYSPLKKLDNLLRALSMVVVNKIDQNGNGGSTRSTPVPPARLGSNNSMLKHNGAVHLGVVKHPPVEELIRWLVYLLAKCSAINCEIEACLLPFHPILRRPSAQEPGQHQEVKEYIGGNEHYGSLTTLQEGSETEPCDSFLRIAVPNEQEGSIEYHTFPVLPQMNVAKLCRVISHQFAITNPEDYGLYILFDGFETYLLPKEYPHVIRDQLSEAGKSHLFAYKRNEARIAWPKNAVSCCTPTEGLQPRST
uniref:Ras-associating domain-containing protein n=1 Tax=Ditylenchus dipsaci TaxID=166011 RepID=A0A915CWH4_9BILA